MAARQKTRKSDVMRAEGNCSVSYGTGTEAVIDGLKRNLEAVYIAWEKALQEIEALKRENLRLSLIAGREEKGDL